MEMPARVFAARPATLGGPGATMIPRLSKCVDMILNIAIFFVRRITNSSQDGRPEYFAHGPQRLGSKVPSNSCFDEFGTVGDAVIPGRPVNATNQEDEHDDE
jgi:hypothetical protein